MDKSVKAEPGRYYHISIALRLLDYHSLTEENYKKLIAPNVEPKMTRKQFRDTLIRLRKKGFKVLPPCNRHKKNGACSGHQNKK